MRFSKMTIAPKGRNKYGNYLAAGNVTSSVVKNVFYGNDSTTDIGGGGGGQGEEDSGHSISFFMFLSKTSNDFDRSRVLASGQTDTANVMAYRGNDRVPCYIMDLSQVRSATTADYEAIEEAEESGETVDFIIVDNPDGDDIVYPKYYGIQNVPASGMSISVLHNGTSAATINITVNSQINITSGTLKIPAQVYLKDYNDMGDNVVAWKCNASDCEMMWLEYQWSISGPIDENYYLDLTNDSAGINCDSEGNIYSGAVQYLHCQAILYYGTSAVTSGVSYGFTTDIDCTGVTINTTTGVFTFGSDLAFDGSHLEIHVFATHRGCTRNKTMTITKQYPGADGSGATTRWIVPSVSAIKVDPNTGTISPATVTAKVMKQVNDESPVEDSATTIYYGYDTENPNNVYNGPIAVVAAHDYLALGLKNARGVFYELETLPILEEGLNGENGENGQSPYYLDLNNQNASINCDINGNLLPRAVRPTCTATLYYGGDPVPNAVYSFGGNYGSGITIGSSTGVITVGTGFTWTGTTIEIVINGSLNNILRGTAIFTLSKNYPGEDGTPATSYWLAPSCDAVHVDKSGNCDPSYVTCAAWKQVGENEPIQLNSTQTPYIYYGFDTVDPGSRYYGSQVSVLTGSSFLCFQLYYNGVQYDIETIPILHDGVDGATGPSGESVYRLDLSNENASINCDINGNLLPGAIRPSCTATLYYGTSVVNNAAYSFGNDYGSGITIGSSSGLITVSNNFTWTGTSIGIVVNAKVNNILRGVAIFTLSKAFPGADGTPATTYWIATTANAVHVDNSGTPQPSSFTVEIYKQVGEDQPVQSAEFACYYGYNTTVTSESRKFYSSKTFYCSGLTEYAYVSLQLKSGSTILDSETVPILHDGKDGGQGVQGRAGAAIRGPVEWTSSAARRWCSGNGNAVGLSTEEDYMFIDIVFRMSGDTKIYYVCNTSYTQSAGSSWNSVSEYWTQAEEQYEFVASRVLLAENAYIDFMTGNEIYLRDSGGTITAGAAGGNGISFWAGDDTPGSAPFRVNYEGSMTATTGTFGCLTIGETNNFGSQLMGSYVGTDDVEREIRISPSYVFLSSDEGENYVRMAPDTDNLDMNGIMEIGCARSSQTALWADGVVYSTRFHQKTKTNPYMGGVLSAPGLYGLEVCFRTTGTTWSNYFAKDGPDNTWTFHGLETGVSYSIWPSAGILANSNGEWMFYNPSLGNNGIHTGIFGPNAPAKDNVLYIVI